MDRLDLRKVRRRAQNSFEFSRRAHKTCLFVFVERIDSGGRCKSSVHHGKGRVRRVAVSRESLAAGNKDLRCAVADWALDQT